jgi:DNA polymerase I-like protein with 3'-5' exonuclease and polymerase domains
VLSQEIIDKVDIHETNRVAFNLGGTAYYEGESKAEADARKKGRLAAKVFKFRLIYGGSAYSYAHDPDFMGISTSEQFWQGIIDQYYAKYYGVAGWHAAIVKEAQEKGFLSIPSGRYYPLPPERDWRGNIKWPITKIKNYPVQGFGADLVMLARLEASKRLRELDVEAKLVSTIHDSIVVDTPSKHLEQVATLLKECVEVVPALCQRIWDYNFALPLTCEVQYGPNKKEMLDFVFA